MPKTSYVPSEKMLRCLYITLNKFRDELKKLVFHLRVKAALTIIITFFAVCMVEMSFFMRVLDSVSATVFSSVMAITGIYFFYDLCMRLIDAKNRYLDIALGMKMGVRITPEMEKAFNENRAFNLKIGKHSSITIEAVTIQSERLGH